MEKYPLVTVLMPCYNAMPFLPEALDSIINQTYRNLEILCINDGSTDETVLVLEQYAVKDHRIRIVHNDSNLKLISSLNIGIELANGSFIARMDADDVSDLNRIEKQLEFFNLHPDTDVLGTSLTIIDENNNTLTKRQTRHKSAEGCFFGSFLYSSVGHPDVMIRADVLKKNNYSLSVDFLHIEDYELWNRLASLGYHLRNIDEYLLKYRLSSSGVSRLYTQLQSENFVAKVAANYSKFTGFTLDYRVAKVLANRIDVTTTYCDLVEGVRSLDTLYNTFVIRRKLNKVDFLDVRNGYLLHLFDIFIQYLKNVRKNDKFYGVWFIVTKLNKLCSITVFRYIFIKLLH